MASVDMDIGRFKPPRHRDDCAGGRVRLSPRGGIMRGMVGTKCGGCGGRGRSRVADAALLAAAAIPEHGCAADAPVVIVGRDPRRFVCDVCDFRGADVDESLIEGPASWPSGFKPRQEPPRASALAESVALPAGTLLADHRPRERVPAAAAPVAAVVVPLRTAYRCRVHLSEHVTWKGHGCGPCADEAAARRRPAVPVRRRDRGADENN